MGRAQKGFDLLGYHITPKGLTPNKQTQEKTAREGPAALCPRDL